MVKMMTFGKEKPSAEMRPVLPLWQVSKMLGITQHRLGKLIDKIIENSESNKDGAVSMDDFHNIMTKKKLAKMSRDKLLAGIMTQEQLQ